MRIHCYFINFNDIFYLKFFYDHYSKFCEKLIMYDQYSTDGSRELAASLGIEVRDFGRKGVLNDQWYLDVKNHCWKECRGKGIDYVIVVDIDEFVTVPDGLTGSLPTVKGYNMISENLPVKDIFEINTGEPSESYSKQAIFNPDYIEEINYVHGCHKHYATGNITTNVNTVCFLYHMRMIGGVERIIERHGIYRARMSEFNKKHKMGFHYQHSDNAKRDEWNFLKLNSVELW